MNVLIHPREINIKSTTMTTAGCARFCGALAVFGFVALQLSFGASASIETVIKQKHVQQLGVEECTYGPSFWCQNITNAAGCHAVKHCIQTTWETQKYPVDNDDVCTICKNMVKEARDTLESNATLDELKQVFYGSCNLLPLKIIKTECKKLSDEFIPELVDTLASQMDPNVVCTVSGLCNNERIDKLLLENKEKEKTKVDGNPHLCEQCAIAMDKGEQLVQGMSSGDVINRILMMCGELSSYSDNCNNKVLTYKDQIYSAIKKGFTKKNVCMLSGMCSEAFHPHADGYKQSKNALMGVEISSAGERGRIQIQKPNVVSDELTCDFCETLVKHLRDILISNTTEEQFLEVLQGLCKQTGSFSDECLSIINEDYGRIYQFLKTELDEKVVCTIVGICPGSLDSRYNFMVPMYPLLPIELIQKLEATKIDESGLITAEKTQSPTLVMVDEQPPKIQDIKSIKKSPVIDLFYRETHFVVNDVDMPEDKTTCFLCQSILNYVQQVVTDPKSEEEIRTALEKSCLIMPSSFEQQCKQFVDQYGDAFISLIAQEVDPSIICPELKLCPVTDISLTANKDRESSNNCPLCIIFMTTLESEITNNDTELVIKTKLKKLCTKLPSKWKSECTDFISGQFQSILDMLVAEVKPEEICTLLDVCKPKTISENIAETNMIASSGQVTIVFPNYNMGHLLANNYKMLEEPQVPTPFCLVCTVVMKYLNGEIKDKSNQAEIQRVLDSVCTVLPNVEENKCQNFIDTNYLQIVKAIQIGTEPGIACMALMVCENNKDEGNIDLVKKNMQLSTKDSVKLDTSDECAACEAFTKVFGNRLNNSSVNIDEIDMVELCNEVEVVHKEQCLEMIDSYAQSFKNLYNRMPTWIFCEEVSLCGKNKSLAVNQLNNSNCLNGVKYWCASMDNAKECKDKNNLLQLLKYGCNAKTEHSNNDWLIRQLIEMMRINCTKNCVYNQNVMGFHPKCTICKDVIKDIKHKIEASTVEKDVEYRLESLCDALPNKSQCVDFVEKYIPKVLNTFIDDIKEESICAEIGYC